MAGAGYRLFATGDVLTAAQVNTYLQQQTVMVFADSSARTTALSGVLAEGMVSYLQSDDTVYVYNGSAWVSIANSGDITSVGVTAPITGGGTSGAVTIGVDTATTSAVGVVQLTNSTSSTSITTAAVPANVKTAYDLAAGAIATSTLTTAGDIIYRNATVPTRLGIGTAGQVLTVNSGATAPQWATPSSGSTFVGVSIYNSSAIAVANGTYVAFTANAENFDTDGFHSTSSNTSRITIPTGKGGKYLVTAKIAMQASAIGTRYCSIYKNGSNVGAASFVPTVGTFSFGFSYVETAVATDYFELYTYQDSGGSRDIYGQNYVPPEGTYFQFIYLGA